MNPIRGNAAITLATAALGSWSTPNPAMSAPAPAEEAISEETVLVIAAAVAAFLGKRAPIRQIRLLGSAAWAQQGRVTIHDLHATMLHLLGLDHTRLTFHFGGRDMRLTDVHGEVIREILA